MKLPEDLENRISSIARRRCVSRSAVIREALESFARQPEGSFIERAADLVGCLEGPRDLSASPEHMKDYGR